MNHSSEFREMTCIICPSGCLLSVTLYPDGRVKSVSGNACRRGIDYAEDECTNPMRLLTTTVLLENGKMLPVRTDRSVPRAKLMDCMREINQKIISPPVSIYDIIIKNVAGTGANVIAAGNTFEKGD